MAYIAMSCVFLFSLVLISSTNSAPVVQEQFFDNYKHTENYLQSCIPTLNVLFDTSTVDLATSAGQPSIFREACPPAPESSQNQARQHTSNLCMLFAYRIHDMCPLSKAMQNNVNEFNTEMMNSFLQHSQTVMDEQKFCGEMTAAPPQGQKSITLSRSETYYISQAAGVQVARPLPLDPSACSHLWKSMGCDRRELNSICQAYAFLATIEGPILESQKVTLDTPGDLQPNEPQSPAEDDALDQSKTASNQGEQGKGVEETPDAELQPPSSEDAQPKNPVGGPINKTPAGNPGNPPEFPINGNPPIGNPGNPPEGPNNENLDANPGNPPESPNNGNPPIGNPGNPPEGPNNENPDANPGNPPEFPINGNPPIGNPGNPPESPNNENPPIGNPGNPPEGPNNENPDANLGNPPESPNNGNPPIGIPGNPPESPNNENPPIGNPGNPPEFPINENPPIGSQGNPPEGPINGNPPIGNPGNPPEGPNNEKPDANLGSPVGGTINENPDVNLGNPVEGAENGVPDDWNREEDGSEESSHIEDNRPGMRPPDDYSSNDDSSEGGYNKNSEDDDRWNANGLENLEEKHDIEPIPGNEENGGFQVQHPVENVKYDDGYDDDDTNTHFMAYSLTAIILILATYIMYHNKQKIIAVVVEGRNGRGRRRRGGSGYQKLDQNISEAMPSMHSQNA